MEGVDVYKTPYLHPKLNTHDSILTKELGYGYCFGTLSSFAYCMLPKSQPPVSPLTSKLNHFLDHSPFLARFRPPFLAQLKSVINKPPFVRSEPLPIDLSARFATAITKAPLIGIQVGGWVALRAYIEYKMAGYRGKVDSDNSFVSSAVVGGLAAAYYRLPIFATAVVLGSAVGIFDCACDRWYFGNNGRGHKAN